MDDVSPIGSIEEISGGATVTRIDGSVEDLTLGSPIYENDIIDTAMDGAVNIVFIDETSMAVSEGARLSIDDYNFDSETENGTTNFSILKGIFVYTSGLIGRDDPDDVSIDTPVGSIGIRGTIIAGKIQPGGDSEITVMEGAIVVKNGTMETTLSEQYESVRLSGFNDNMQDLGVKNASDVSKPYGSVSDVVPKLFSSINDNAKEEQKNNEPTKETTEDDVISEDTEEIKLDEINDEATEEPVIEKSLELNINDLNQEQKSSNLRDKKSLKKDLTNNNREEKNLQDDIFVNLNQNYNTDAKLNFIERPVFEGSEAGSLVSRIVVRDAPANIEFTVNGPGASNYITEEIANGIFEIRLNNPAGAVGTSVGDLVITATLPNGQSFNWNISPQILDASVNLGTNTGLNHPVQNIGNFIGPTKIGDFNGDGTNDFAHINATNDLIIEDMPASLIDTITGLNFAALSATGDLNNDGFDDIIAGSPNAGNGEAYIINGTDSVATPTALTSATNTGDQKGFAVTGLGDFDGDGKTDYAYSSLSDDAGGTNRGKIFIKSDGGININVSGHEDGMKLGEELEYIGDIDGNGLSDLLIKAEGTVGGLHKAYVVLGHDTGITNIDTSAGTVAGTKLFEIESASSIVSGGFIGDTNGDGFDDFAISLDTGTAINTFVIYGQNSFPNIIDDTYLEDPNNALKIHHDGANATNYEVTGIGDINGDGLDDIRLGNDGNDKYIVFGDHSSADVVTDGSVNDGASEAGLIEATASGQSLFGNGHFRDNGEDNLSMVGGNANNSFGISDTEFRNIDGGAGLDTIRFSGTSLNFSNVNFEEISGIDRVQFATDSNTISLTTENIFNLLKTSDDGILRIDLGKTGNTDATNATLQVLKDIGDASSTTIAQALENDSDANVVVGTEVIGSKTYDHYEIGGYNLYIENHGDLNVAIV